MKIIVGLTGNIASGKSTASEILRELGANVINADLIVYDLYSKNKELIKKLCKEFGKSILNKEGTIDRKKLGSIAFYNKKKMKKLIDIVWPYVTKEVKKRISKIKKGIIIVEATFLFEAGWKRFVDYSILVTSHKRKRMERLMKRNPDYSLSYIKQIINSHDDSRFKDIHFDYIIHNNSTLDSLRKKVKKVYSSLKAPKKF